MSCASDTWTLLNFLPDKVSWFTFIWSPVEMNVTHVPYWSKMRLSHTVQCMVIKQCNRSQSLCVPLDELGYLSIFWCVSNNISALWWWLLTKHPVNKFDRFRSTDTCTSVSNYAHGLNDTYSLIQLFFFPPIDTLSTCFKLIYISICNSQCIAPL